MVITGFNMHNWIKSSIKMFADTKLWTTISDVDDKQKLQDDLRKLKRWSDKWLLKCNPDKCRVMHVRHNYPTEYYMEQDSKLCKLIEATEEKDLGVITTYDLKPARQCAEAAKKATAILRLIKRHFHDMNIPTYRLSRANSEESYKVGPRIETFNIRRTSAST